MRFCINRLARATTAAAVTIGSKDSAGCDRPAARRWGRAARRRGRVPDRDGVRARRQSARQRVRAACRSGRPPFSSRAGAAQCGFPTIAARPRSACRQGPRLPYPKAEPATGIDESARSPRRRPACRRPQAAPAARKLQPRGEVGEQAFLAAEQMAGTFDVEEKTIGAVLLAKSEKARRWRVARRPQGQAAQCRIVGGGIHRAHLQKIGFRPRVGQRFAERKSAVRPLRSGRRCAGRRRPQRRGRRAVQDRPVCNSLASAPSPAPRESAGSASAAAKLKRCAT